MRFAAIFVFALTLLGATPTTPSVAGSVHVDQYGTGSSTLVLIPGLTDSGAVWGTTVAHYQATHTIYVLTLPGFGGRPRIAAPMLDTVDRDIAAFLPRANKPVLIGHSLGGFLATRLAEEHSDLIRGVISIDGLPVFPGLDKMAAQQRAALATMSSSRIAAATPAEFANAQQRQLAVMTKPQNVAAAQRFSAGADQSATATYLGEMLSADLRPNLAKITVPFTLIGPFDASIDPKNPYNPLVTLTAKQAYYQSLVAGDPAAKVVIVDDSRHFVMLDQPEKLFAAVDTFLASL